MIAKIMMKMIVILMFIFLVIEVQTFQFQNYYLKHPSSILSLTNNRDHHHHYHHSSTRLPMMAKNKFKRSDFEGKDIFSEDDDDLPDDPAFSSAKRKANKKNNNSNPSDASNTDNKKKVKLEPETVFFEGPPSASEVIFPAISVLTVIGIVPFISAVTRQFWVKYKFTSRRISIRSGFQGNTQTDVIYSDINEIKFVYRLFGAAGDMVLFLKDGAKVELRHVPKFEEIYNYVISKCDSECQEKSMKLKTNSNNTSANGNNNNSNAEAVNR